MEADKPDPPASKPEGLALLWKTIRLAMLTIAVTVALLFIIMLMVGHFMSGDS